MGGGLRFAFALLVLQTTVGRTTFGWLGEQIRKLLSFSQYGSAVFRKYLPRYSRSQVAFFGSEFFAYSEPYPRPGVVRVLRLPQ